MHQLDNTSYKIKHILKFALNDLLKILSFEMIYLSWILEVQSNFVIKFKNLFNASIYLKRERYVFRSILFKKKKCS